MDKINSLDDYNKLYNSLISNEDSIVITVGRATCGIASGANDIFETIKKEIDNRNLNVKIKSVGCIGECYNEPIVEVIINNQISRYNKVTKESINTIIEDMLAKRATNNITREFIGQVRIALENCGIINPEDIEDYISKNGYKALVKVVFSMTKEEVIEEIKKSGLRGRGGAGFPTVIKWETVKNATSDEKYIICNADEGDPGAFMDRAILESDPHKVIEAMIIAGFTTGASKGIIYIRKEYPLAVERLEKAIQDAIVYGFLGKNILGTDFNFNITINLGAGAFVCGEETSLLNSIEGKRGEPRVKPPFPADEGLYGKPTLINNVETYANIPVLLLKGSTWFNGIGNSSKGTKVFALAGKINNTGLIEVPIGTTLKSIVYDIGGGIKDGKSFKAVQTGGPSGGCIPASLIDISLDYESLKEIGSMMGSGGMIVMDEDDCMVDIAKYYLDFSVEESCGKCTPCRIGNLRLYEALDRITKNESKIEDLDYIKELGNVIKDTALCGLGQASPNPVLSTMNYFYDEYKEHIVNHKCPASKCLALINYVINPDKCIGCGNCAKNCPSSCIQGTLKEKHEIIQEKCIKCGTCYKVCPVQAVEKK